MADAMREAAEHAYTMTAHNYAEAPVGSRDWTPYWRGWQAALAAQQPAQGGSVWLWPSEDCGCSYSACFTPDGAVKPNGDRPFRVYTAPPAPSTSVPEQRLMIAMVDAAMVEMTNLHPPLKLSECGRLIHAAMLASGGKASAQPAPSVPEDTARDAARYRHIRDSIGGGRLVEDFAYSDLDAALDAEIAAAVAAQQ